MKQALIAAYILLITSAVSAQKVINDPNVGVRTVTSFHSISVSGSIDLFLSYGEEGLAVSAAKPEMRDKIITEVKDGVLKIYKQYKTGIHFTDYTKMKAYVSYKTLKSLSASGGSEIVVDGTIKTNSLKINISGGSEFEGIVAVTDLVIDQSGGTDVKIEGFVSKLSISASGGSDFSGYGLIAEICHAEASGGSDIEITANKELSAKASGASEVSYKGKPVLKEVKASGASSVSHKS